MPQVPRRRRRRTHSRPAAENPAIPQLPRQLVRNIYAPLCPLSQDQVEDIHNASLVILQQYGMQVTSAKARGLFKKIGGEVDEESQMVRLDKDLVMQYMSYAPAQFTVTPRNPENRVYVGGNVVNFSMVSGPPNVHDRINGRRMANFADFEKFTKLGQYFNVVNMFGNQTMPPIDLPANTRHLDTYLCMLVNSDKAFNSTPIGVGRAMDAVHMMAIACGISVEEMRHAPAMATNINTNSPRKLDTALADAAIAYAEIGQPVVVTPFTLMGAMTPVTLAAALAQQNAEALLGLVMLQAANPGSPCVYGGFTSNVDLRSGAPAFGTPENAQANLASGQLARRYNLPFRISPCNASNSCDSQSTYETMMAMMGAIFGGGNLIYHAAGWLEGGLLASYEKFIIDIEIIQHFIGCLQPIDTDPASMGLEAIDGVSPGGHFFACEHTQERYRTAFYQPLLSDWKNFENWELAGSRSAEQRASDIWQKALEEFEPPPLDVDKVEALEEYVAKRKQAIGDGEP